MGARVLARGPLDRVRLPERKQRVCAVVYAVNNMARGHQNQPARVFGNTCGYPAVSGVRSMFTAVDLSQRTRCNGPERPSNLRWRFATAVIRPVGVALKRARDNIMRRTASERRSAAWPQYNRLFRLVVLSPRWRRLRARMMSALDGRGNGDRGGKVVAVGCIFLVLFSLSKPELGSA